MLTPETAAGLVTYWHSLPSDDDRRYFGLIVTAAYDLVSLQRMGLMGGGPSFDMDRIQFIRKLAKESGYRYSDEELNEKGLDLIRQYNDKVDE